MKIHLYFGYLALSFHHCCDQSIPVSTAAILSSCNLENSERKALLKHFPAIDSLNSPCCWPVEPSAASAELASMLPVEEKNTYRKKKRSVIWMEESQKKKKRKFYIYFFHVKNIYAHKGKF